MASMTAGRQSVVLEPTTQRLVDSVASGPPLYTLTPQAARDVLTRVQRMPVAKLPASIQDTLLPVGPTGETRVRIVRPEGASGPLPVVMWFHGGGWVLGDPDSYDRLVREVAEGTRAAVVFVDYERSPEARYPVAIEQAYAAFHHVASRGAELGLDPSRIALAGDSAGGNMVAVVSLLAKQRRGPQAAFLLMYYPVTDGSMTESTYTTFENGPYLTKRTMAWFWDAYLPDLEGRKEITASPLNATLDQLAGLPDAMIIVDENDVLREEGEAFARKLSQAGVRATSIRYNGTIHDFVLLNPLAGTPAARAALREGVDALKSALHS